MKKNYRLIRLALYSMYGAVMYVGQFMMEFLPNIHPVTMFIIVLSAVYGLRALIPIYVYVFLEGFFGGFSLWWMPYLYIWALQCFISYPVTRLFRGKAAYAAYPILGALLGISFGVMYAPAQAILFRFDLSTTIKWVIAGLPYDIIHSVGDFVMCLIATPLAALIRTLHRSGNIPI